MINHVRNTCGYGCLSLRKESIVVIELKPIYHGCSSGRLLIWETVVQNHCNIDIQGYVQQPHNSVISTLLANSVIPVPTEKDVLYNIQNPVSEVVHGITNPSWSH